MCMFVTCTVPALEKTKNTSRKAFEGYSFIDGINFPISQFLDEGILDTGNAGLKGCKEEESGW